MPDRDHRPLGVLGMSCALAGGVITLVAFVGLVWLQPTSLSADFTQVRHAVSASGINGLSDAYFTWLAWVLLVVAFALAVVANTGGGAARGAGVLGGLVGLAGAVLTVFALRLTDGQSLRRYLDAAGAGFWAAVIGFALVALGAALGVSRKPAPLP